MHEIVEVGEVNTMNGSGLIDDLEPIPLGIAACTSARNQAGYDVAVLHMILQASAPELRAKPPRRRIIITIEARETREEKEH